MRVIVPAAGIGRRLRPYTDARPKPLVPVCGRRLIARTMGQLAHAGVDEVVCVTGYRAGFLERALVDLRDRPALHFVRNDRFGTTNSIVSLALTRRWWDRDVCIIDADVCFTDGLLARVLDAPTDAVALDVSKPAQSMDMRAEVRDGRLVWLDKNLPDTRTTGEACGLSRWTPRGLEALGRSVDRLLAAGCTDAWYEFAIRDAAGSVPIAIVEVSSDEWAEVDAPEDLAAAERLVRAARQRDRPRASARPTA
jgi:choline kinase